MSTQADRSARLRLVGENMDLELPMDLSRRIIDEAARLGVTAELLVNEALRQALAQQGYDVGPPFIDLPFGNLPSTDPGPGRDTT